MCATELVLTTIAYSAQEVPQVAALFCALLRPTFVLERAADKRVRTPSRHSSNHAVALSLTVRIATADLTAATVATVHSACCSTGRTVAAHSGLGATGVPQRGITHSLTVTA